jgi:hypothetical protein
MGYEVQVAHDGAAALAAAQDRVKPISPETLGRLLER